MLELRPSCECCDKDLPPAATDAMICTFECTFCRDCVNEKLNGQCPNCGGNFAPRPIRPPSKLAKSPPSTKRIFNPQGCGRAETSKCSGRIVAGDNGRPPRQYSPCRRSLLALRLVSDELSQHLFDLSPVGLFALWRGRICFRPN
jgi:hypothetical protein